MPMKDVVVYNGQLLLSESPSIKTDNRGLRYGDGLFETMRLFEGRIWLEKFHFERLFDGMQKLHFEKPLNMTAETFTEEILLLSEKNHHKTHAKIRLMIFRGSGGLYDPANHIPNYIIEAISTDAPPEDLLQEGIKLDIFPDARKSCDRFSSLKTNNFLPYAMGAIYATAHHLQDVIILNAFDRICETTLANIFIIKENTIYTPPITEGCIAGVMRKYLLTQLPVFGFNITEKPINQEDLESAEEIFLSNSVFAIRSVKQFGDKKYTNNSTKIIYKAILSDLCAPVQHHK